MSWKATLVILLPSSKYSKLVRFVFEAGAEVYFLPGFLAERRPSTCERKQNPLEPGRRLLKYYGYDTFLLRNAQNSSSQGAFIGTGPSPRTPQMCLRNKGPGSSLNPPPHRLSRNGVDARNASIFKETVAQQPWRRIPV